MSKLSVIVTIDVEPGKINEVASLLIAHGKRCVDNEPGTLQLDILQPTQSIERRFNSESDPPQMEVSQPNEEDHKLMFYESYQDEAAFEVHLNGLYFKRISEECNGMVKTMSSIRCSVLD